MIWHYFQQCNHLQSSAASQVDIFFINEIKPKKKSYQYSFNFIVHFVEEMVRPMPYPTSRGRQRWSMLETQSVDHWDHWMWYQLITGLLLGVRHDSLFPSRCVQVECPRGLWHRYGRPWDREGCRHHPVTVQEVPEEEAWWEVIVSGTAAAAATVWHLHANKFMPAGSAGCVGGWGWTGMRNAC